MAIDWRDLPSLSMLRAFEATARLNGYSAAARALNVTPAAIAQHVRNLETDVGATLVRRKGRGLELTEDGRQLAAPLAEGFALIARGIDDLKLQRAARGVRVSTTDFFVDAMILPRLGDLWQKHPGLQVSFTPEGNKSPVDLDRFDVVIRGAGRNHVWDGLGQTKLLETQMIVSAAPDLVGDRKADLSRLPWILDRTLGGTVFEDMVRLVGCDPDTIRLVDPASGKFEFEAALMGLGVLVGPEVTVRKNLADGSLVCLAKPPEMDSAYFAVHREGALAEPVQHFLDWLGCILDRGQ